MTAGDPSTVETAMVDNALELLRHSARVSPVLRDAVDIVQRGVRDLREAVGRHDPTGADHMEEMWALAQQRDAVLDLHAKGHDGYLMEDICEHCSDAEDGRWATWPCATVSLLNARPKESE